MLVMLYWCCGFCRTAAAAPQHPAPIWDRKEMVLVAFETKVWLLFLVVVWFFSFDFVFLGFFMEQMQFMESLSFLWERLTVNLHVNWTYLWACSEVQRVDIPHACPRVVYLSLWALQHKHPWLRVTVGGGGKARVQEGNCSSLEMWKGGLHPQHLVQERKDYCLHVTSCGRD